MGPGIVGEPLKGTGALKGKVPATTTPPPRCATGAEGARRARNAVRRALPAKREGLALHKAVKARGPGERVAEARRRGWLGPA